MKKNGSILVVDDELQIQKLLRLTLESNGYAVELARTGSLGLQLAATNLPDMVILDLGLPDLDGMEVLARLREWAKFPVIILSVRDSEQDIVNALDAGADDYLVKPFRTSELLARIRAAVRHLPSASEETVYEFGPLHVDLASHTCRKNDVHVKLTSTEFDLLALLVRNAGKVVTHGYAMEKIWGPQHVGETQYLRVYIGQLRKKIEDDPTKPRWILTESGIGYRFQL